MDKNIDKDFDRLFSVLDKFTEELEANTIGTNAKKYSEPFEIELGESVYLTDPCYDLTSFGQTYLKNIKPGRYLVTIDYLKSSPAEYKRVTVCHVDYVNRKRFTKRDESLLGVDSGQLSVIDGKYYEKNHFDYNIDDEWYNSHCVINNESYDDCEENGVIFSTSFGDGDYIAEKCYINDEVIKVTIEC